jgi:hypothetical protein
MQLTISTSQQQFQFDYTQSNLGQTLKSAVPQQQLPVRQDRIELSDDARRPHDTEHAVRQMRKAHHDYSNNSPLASFLKDILEKISGGRVNELTTAPPVSGTPAATVPPAQNQFSSISAEQSTLSFETSSFSLGGSITTGDGAKFSYSLDLQMLHASASSSSFNLTNGPGGYDFNFAGSSAELTSTSFSFSLTTELPDGTSGTGSGLGSFSLKDDLKEMQQTLKPYIEAFMKESGIPSDKNSVKQLLRTIA